MKRRKKAPETLAKEEQKIAAIVRSLSEGNWNPEERETSILFDIPNKVVYLETSYGPDARRWFKNLWGDPKVKFDTHADTLKIEVPYEYCRQPDLILRAKFRKYDD